MFSETLERSLQKMIGFRKLLQQVTRRGNPPDIVSALLQADARDKAFFEQRDKLDAIAARMTTPVRTVTVNRDDEHNAFFLFVEDRSQGYPRTYSIGLDFITSGEYRTLIAAFREIRDVTFPEDRLFDRLRVDGALARHDGLLAAEDHDDRHVKRRRRNPTVLGQDLLERPVWKHLDPVAGLVADQRVADESVLDQLHQTRNGYKQYPRSKVFF